ncbi:MAG: hypothetical protein KKD10_00270 [Candidatus Omnitrophica bacterium]|nr:hypothetical protein [Candidatus Omnitrophota bacterium]
MIRSIDRQMASLEVSVSGCSCACACSCSCSCDCSGLLNISFITEAACSSADASGSRAYPRMRNSGTVREAHGTTVLE